MHAVCGRSLAIKNINEFLYGVRANRRRKTGKGDDDEEDEPMLYMFWQCSHHGVPMELRRPADDFDFYLDLLACVAKTVSEEHTLNMKGGAFWNLLGSMNEIQLPVFVLINALTKIFGTAQPELFERLKKLVLQKAAKFIKDCKDPKTAPKPAPSYHWQVLGSASLDSRGHLPLEHFLQLSLDCAYAQRAKDAKHLSEIYESWDEKGEHSFDLFAEMLTHSVPDMVENDLIALYQTATSGDDPDKINLGLISPEDIEEVEYPGAGYAIFMQGSKIAHAVSAVTAAREPRMTVVNSYQSLNPFSSDRPGARASVQCPTKLRLLAGFFFGFSGPKLPFL